jgi:hypothetical protein
MIGANDDQKIHSLRYVEPISSFRSTFAYTNITHIVAQRIAAKQAGFCEVARHRGRGSAMATSLKPD